MPGQLLALLSDDELDLTPAPPEFEALAALHLGGLENVESAIDLDLLDVAAALDDAPAVLGALHSDELDISGETPEVGVELEAPIAAEMADAQAHGDGELAFHEQDVVNG